jgi:hypothetical protein
MAVGALLSHSSPKTGLEWGTQHLLPVKIGGQRYPTGLEKLPKVAHTWPLVNALGKVDGLGR